MADLSLAPAIDTPAISIAAIGTTAAPLLAGSPGWFREKRLGVAESPAGASQTSTADLDLVGSTHFRYPAVPAALGHAANAGQFVVTAQKPGSTAAVQNAKWLFNLEFTTDASAVQLRLRAPVAAPMLGMVLVNGRRIQEGAYSFSGLTAGNAYAVTLTFPSAGPRVVQIRGMWNTDGGFGGATVSAEYSLTKTSPTISRRVAIIGDSYVNGAGSYASSGANSVETFAWRLAALMGADEVVQAGIGGTGWVNQLSTGADSLFAARVAPVMALSPHVVIFAGGRNDPAAGLQAAVEQSLDAVGSGVERYVLPTASEATQADRRAAIQAACTSRSVRYLDVAVDSRPKIADGIHMTYPGHVSYADDAYSLLQPAPMPPASVVAPVVRRRLSVSPRRAGDLASAQRRQGRDLTGRTRR